MAIETPFGTPKPVITTENPYVAPVNDTATEGTASDIDTAFAALDTAVANVKASATAAIKSAATPVDPNAAKIAALKAELAAAEAASGTAPYQEV